MFYGKLKVSNIDILLYITLYNIPFTGPVRYETDLHALCFTPSEHTEYSRFPPGVLDRQKR